MASHQRKCSGELSTQKTTDDSRGEGKIVFTRRNKEVYTVPFEDVHPGFGAMPYQGWVHQIRSVGYTGEFESLVRTLINKFDRPSGWDQLEHQRNLPIWIRAKQEKWRHYHGVPERIMKMQVKIAEEVVAADPLDSSIKLIHNPVQPIEAQLKAMRELQKNMVAPRTPPASSKSSRSEIASSSSSSLPN